MREPTVSSRQAPDRVPAEPPPPGWTPDLLDVPAYLARLGVASLPAPTATALRDLHRAHVAAIPFENLDIIVGRGVDLAMPALQAKLVARRRGGYCFEHNLLFAALLERAGFAVTRLSGRARMGASFVRPRTHMVLEVRDSDGQPWLADVGFGGEGLLEPIPLEHEATSVQGGWTYRVVREPDGWTWGAQALHPDGWYDLYGFSREPQHPMDYVMANHFTATSPLSPFTHVPTAQRTEQDRRLAMRGRTLTETRPDGGAEERTVDADDLEALLPDRFGIVLTPEELEVLRARW